jgi:hypothetical protein
VSVYCFWSSPSPYDAFPNAYEDIARLLSAGTAHRVRPERSWFLIELDSPAYGSGVRVPPSTAANYEALAIPLRPQFPETRWAAHGQGVTGCTLIERLLMVRTFASVSKMSSTCRMAASRGATPSW